MLYFEQHWLAQCHSFPHQGQAEGGAGLPQPPPMPRWGHSTAICPVAWQRKQHFPLIWSAAAKAPAKAAVWYSTDTTQLHASIICTNVVLIGNAWSIFSQSLFPFSTANFNINASFASQLSICLSTASHNLSINCMYSSLTCCLILINEGSGFPTSGNFNNAWRARNADCHKMASLSLACNLRSRNGSVPELWDPGSHKRVARQSLQIL